ncbi:phage portal protein [Deinococcus oregonensis]|uniref:Phage portal protein n=1 Tax=Deinococcus oregonensis TaxID=1805970 RepID=A0ABV6B6M2_9DEIO
MGWKETLGMWLGLEMKLQAPAKGALPFVSAGNDGRAVSSDWSTEKAINEGMKASTWVYTACRKVSTALASVTLIVEKRKGDEWEPDPKHPLQALLDRPNPYMSRQDMHERWVLHLMLGGNAIWHKVLVGGKPVEVWPLLPDQIKPIPSRAGFVSGYEWKQGSDKQTLPPEQVLHWQFADPSTPYWGLSPLRAAAAAVDTDLAAVRWNRATLANDGRPPMAVFLSESLDAGQQELAARFIHGQIDGGNVRKALILGGASKVQPLALNATEMDWLQGRRFSREEIGAVFGVPPVLMVAGEGVTFANLDAAKRILWEDTVVPLLDDLCQGLSMGLLPHWGAEGTHRIKADLSGVTALQENLKERADAAKILVEAGFPINAVNQRLALGFGPVAGGDQPRAPTPAPGAAPPAATKSRPRPPPRYQRKDKGEDDVAARLARMDKWTLELKKKVAEVLFEQGSSVASAYAAGKPWETALNMDDWQALLEAAHLAIIESEGAVAYTALLGSITAAGGGGVFDVLADGVQEWISEHVGENIKYIDETSKLALQAEIAAGVDAGESTKDIAKRLKAVHEDWTGWRAERIARTETASAFSAAHQQSASQIADEFELELVKTWKATGDSRTRDQHAAMDGETVALDEAFSNGLMQPGEPNCRCVVIYQPAE